MAKYRKVFPISPVFDLNKPLRREKRQQQSFAATLQAALGHGTFATGRLVGYQILASKNGCDRAYGWFPIFSFIFHPTEMMSFLVVKQCAFVCWSRCQFSQVSRCVVTIRRSALFQAPDLETMKLEPESQEVGMNIFVNHLAALGPLPKTLMFFESWFSANDAPRSSLNR